MATVSDIKKQLTDAGITFDPTALKPELEALLATIPLASGDPVQPTTTPGAAPVAVAKGGIKLDDIIVGVAEDNEEQTRLRGVFAAAFVQRPEKATDEEFKQDLLNQIARAGDVTA